MKYGIVIEQGPNNYSAYVPDLPGCISTGKSLNEVRQNIQEAIEFHLEGMKEDGLEPPPPSTLCEYIEAPNQAA